MMIQNYLMFSSPALMYVKKNSGKVFFHHFSMMTQNYLMLSSPALMYVKKNSGKVFFSSINSST